MHSTKSAVLLLALAISASCVVATPHLPFLDEIFDSINQTGHHIISGFVNATRNGTAIAGEFLDSIRNSSAQYTHETVEFAHKIADAVHRAASEAIVDFFVTLQASIDIVHQQVGLVRNILQQKALKDALATLQTVTAVVNDLEVAVNNLNDQLDEKKLEYSAIIQVKWSLWTDDQLNRVDELTNGVGNEEAEEIMDELVSRYSGYLHSCLEELQVQQATYEQNVQEAIVKYHNATNKLTAQVELCVQSNLNYRSCRNGINTALRALDSAPADLLTLKLQGIRLLAIGLNANGCVGQTLADHELEKPSVELKLDEIIRQYQEQQNEEATTIS
ncbi:uncharacterized protein LOC6732192 [Drosophila simulans]|uniref:GD23888 n=1 Tax=Drosophila simulans TaxID=7240 RepID=B4Q4R8_DROSI|nr:uncharacterized protein LOC6732192 [Drosophila simulans]EDX04906.1 GD23888 [Drosophila simulans]KMY90076.1 uncharacterized protein Dsimw501_GD23888 [Drosophila simulans]